MYYHYRKKQDMFVTLKCHLHVIRPSADAYRQNVPTYQRWALYTEKCERLNSLPNDEISEWSKFKAHADNTINETQKLDFILRRVENSLGKEENAGY